jgi:hypothetical protein
MEQRTTEPALDPSHALNPDFWTMRGYLRKTSLSPLVRRMAFTFGTPSLASRSTLSMAAAE